MRGMQPAFALELSTTFLVIVGAISVVVLVLIVVAPWRRVRNEPPLDPNVETKLLLRRDPDEPTDEVPRVPSTSDISEPSQPGADDFSELANLEDIADE
jgi:hypothetical protein